MHRKQKQGKHHHQNNQYNQDPFGMDNDDFGFGIRDEFDDPFEGMMGGFGFPNFEQMHQRLFGNIERAFRGMGMGMGRLGDGNEGNNNRINENPNQGRLRKANTNNFQSFFSNFFHFKY